MDLQEFLNSTNAGLKEKVAVSERLKIEKGEYFLFEIKAAEQKQFEELQKKNTIYGKKGKVTFNNVSFQNELIIENTIYPNFKDAESIKKLNCSSPEEYVEKVLLPGEISRLADCILKLSGFDNDFEDRLESAKNY